MNCQLPSFHYQPLLVGQQLPSDTSQPSVMGQALTAALCSISVAWFLFCFKTDLVRVCLPIRSQQALMHVSVVLQLHPTVLLFIPLSLLRFDKGCAGQGGPDGPRHLNRLAFFSAFIRCYTVGLLTPLLFLLLQNCTWCSVCHDHWLWLFSLLFWG